MAYCLDANIFIEAKNRYYPMDIAPGFWDALERAGQSAHIFVIQAVFKEITDGNDDLSEWMKPRTFLRRDHRACAMTQSFYPALGLLLEQRQPKYKREAIDEFHAGADPWIVCFAKANAHVVVSHEGTYPQSGRKVSIPDVCGLMGVACIDAFALLRALGARLVLGT